MSAKTLLTLLVFVVFSFGSSHAAQANWWQFWKVFTRPSPTLFKNPAPNPARPVVTRSMPRQQYSLELRKNMGKANVVCEIAWQAHHIIPVEFAQHDALRKCGFNINAAANGICMPGAKVGGAKGIAQHSGYHAGYSAAVKEALDGIPKSLPKRPACERINKIQTCLRNGIQAGTPLYGENANSAWQTCKF
jgi:hypothetical protein